MARGETYEQFVDKFKQKKTTDDCYTPAKVRTAFLTNMEPETAARSDVELSRVIQALRTDKSKPKTAMPDNWWTAARLMTAANHGETVMIPRDRATFIRKRPDGKRIYGGALIYEELDSEAH